MYTSILLVAMAGTQAPLAASAPDWKSDYATASREGKTAHKPLAVFVGRGADGWGQVSDSGKLGTEARGLLGDKFVCLYVDRDTKEGQQLAEAFELTPDVPGLVISDSTGDLQAFRHSGRLTPDDLSRYLRTYSDTARTVTRTDMVGQESVRSYPPNAAAGQYYPSFSSCPSCQQRR